MLLDFLVNMRDVLYIFSFARIKKLAVLVIYAILILNVILRKMYHQSTSSYDYLLYRILPVQTFMAVTKCCFLYHM